MQNTAEFIGEEKGDCIDCLACVRVCPTGIDIRNGTQLECINCTACIDACDAIMISIGKPTGLIRYASEESLHHKISLRLNKRIIAYSVVLLLLLTTLVFLLAGRSDIDARLMRTAGMTYTSMPDGRISNLFNLKLLNKTHEDIPFTLQLKNTKGEISIINMKEMILKRELHTTLQFFVIMNRADVKNWKTPVQLELKDSKGNKIKSLTAQFIGPEIYN